MREVSLTIHDGHDQGTLGLTTSGSSPSAELMRDEQTQALERAVSRLPDDYRRVIHLRYREELPFDVIAEIMERSPNAVRKLWARAIESLQQEFKSPP